MGGAMRWSALLTAFGLALAACAPTAPPTPTPKAGPPPAVKDQAAVEQGKQLFVSKGCVACHTVRDIPQAKGTVGPALDGVASWPKIAGTIDNTPENLQKWIKDPQAMKPGTQMPTLGLTDDEAAKITAFLLTLR